MCFRSRIKLYKKPVLAQPVLDKQVLAQPVLAQPVLAQQVLAQQVLAQPVLAQQVLAQVLDTKETLKTVATAFTAVAVEALNTVTEAAVQLEEGQIMDSKPLSIDTMASADNAGPVVAVDYAADVINALTATIDCVDCADEYADMPPLESVQGAGPEVDIDDMPPLEYLGPNNTFVTFDSFNDVYNMILNDMPELIPVTTQVPT